MNHFIDEVPCACAMSAVTFQFTSPCYCALDSSQLLALSFSIEQSFFCLSCVLLQASGATYDCARRTFSDGCFVQFLGVQQALVSCAQAQQPRVNFHRPQASHTFFPQSSVCFPLAVHLLVLLCHLSLTFHRAPLSFCCFPSLPIIFSFASCVSSGFL